MKKSKFGTREWAEHNKNIMLGCRNNCRYCYARYNAVKRAKKTTNEKWGDPILNLGEVHKRQKKYNGRIMFPTQHDLFPECYAEIKTYLTNLLSAGNEVLIVTKPRFSVISELCSDLCLYKDQILFRFTIGSVRNSTLHFWEPNAPSFAERLYSLQYASESGYQTSVSCEPYLDSSIYSLVPILLDYVTESIWIGIVNFVQQRVDTTGFKTSDWNFFNRMMGVSSFEFVEKLYHDFHIRYGKIMWKESIRKLLKLDEFSEESDE